MNQKEQLRNSFEKAIIDRGLTPDESKIFMGLLDKLKPNETDMKAFEHEMCEGIPFEGGMGFTEALTGLLIANNLTK